MLSRPEAVRHAPADNRDGGSLISIKLVKGPSFQDWNAERCKEVFADDLGVGRRVFGSRGQRPALYREEGCPVIDIARGYIARSRNRVHSWNRRHGREHPFKEGPNLRVFISIRRKRQVQDQNTGGLVALKYVELLKEAFDHQSGGDKQDQRQHHLSDDETTTEAAATPKQTNSLGSLLERSIEIKFRALQG